MSGKRPPFKFVVKKSKVVDDIEDDDGPNPSRQNRNPNRPNPIVLGRAKDSEVESLTRTFIIDEYFNAARNGDFSWLNQADFSKIFVDTKDHSGFSFLYYAAKQGEVDAVVLLLKAGANPNLKLYQNFTAIHAAAEANQGSEQDYVSIIRLLISHKADINVVPTRSQDLAPMTPVQIAYAQKKSAILDVLLKYQPNITQQERETYQKYLSEKPISNNNNNNNSQPNSQGDNAGLLDMPRSYRPSQSSQPIAQGNPNQPMIIKTDRAVQTEGVRTRSYYNKK